MKERVLTAIVLLLIVVGALFLDPTGWAVKVLIVLVALVCGSELDKLCTDRIPSWSAGILLVLMLFLGQPYDFKSYDLKFFFPPIAFLSAPILIYLVEKRKGNATLIATFGWILGTMGSVYVLASTKSPGTWPLLLTAAIPIWCGDTAAIFVGKAFGKHKLAPAISPNKTWEGSIGNLLACIGAALALGAIFHYPLPLMLLLGINCGILGQAGDLFESWLKRKADVKDSGNILPGHGGLLDRLDSLMATAPISLLILQSLVVSGTHN